MFGVLCIQQGQSIELDVVFLGVLDGPHHPVPRPAAGMIGAVVIVELLRPVDADADEEFALVQEPAPFLIEQNRVGLYRVADLLAGYAIFLLQLHGLLVEVQSHQRRLASLPGKAGQPKTQLHVVLDEFFEHFFAHSLPTLADIGGASFIKTVLAIDVTVGT